MEYPKGKLEHTLTALATEGGEIVLEVWVVGGVTSKGRELDPEPWKAAYPSETRAKAAAKKLGPKCWASRALVPLGRRIRWAK